MPLSRSVDFGDWSTDGQGDAAWVTGSFTPPDNSLLVVTTYVQDDSSATDLGDDMTVSGGGWTYTRRKTVQEGTSWATGMVQWTAPVGTGASMTLTIDCGANNIRSYFVTVVAYTGYDTVTVVGADASDNLMATDGADTLTLSAAPASSSEVVASLRPEGINSNTAVAHGAADWTEAVDTAASGRFGGLQTQVRGGSTSTTVTWDDVASHQGATQVVGIALEILAAAVVALIEPPLIRSFAVTRAASY